MKPNWEISQNELGEQIKLQIGSCGEIYLGKWEYIPVVIKVFHSHLHLTNELITEVEKMLFLRHPNIVNTYAFYKTPFCLIMEYLEGGTLREVLDTQLLNWETRIKYAKQIAYGLCYLHHQDPSFIHQNLTTNTIMLNKYGDIKLINFGLFKKVQCEAANHYIEALSYEAPFYEAPEVVKDKEYTIKSDIYSFGIILWELASQNRPFVINQLRPHMFMQTRYNIQLAIQNGIRPPIDVNWPREYRGMIESCWQPEARHRPTIDGVIEFIEKYEQKILTDAENLCKTQIKAFPL